MHAPFQKNLEDLEYLLDFTQTAVDVVAITETENYKK